ncbi:type II toxin-antitoxin system VapC family toxin [Acidobacteriota bacterium]
MEKILVDSCIFIDIFRGNTQLYQDLLKQKVLLSSIVHMELIQGARDKIELEKIDKFLKKFKVFPITQKISKKSMELIKTYSISHGLLIPDALIAATAIIKNFPLWTFNQKDFRFISDLALYVAGDKSGEKSEKINLQ